MHTNTNHIIFFISDFFGFFGCIPFCLSVVTEDLPIFCRNAHARSALLHYYMITPRQPIMVDFCLLNIEARTTDMTLSRTELIIHDSALLLID